LKKLGAWNEKRWTLTESYRALLSEHCPDVAMPFSQPRPSAHHILPVVLPKDVDRQVVVDKLRDEGIQTTNHYPPIHWFSLYRDKFPSVHLPQTEDFALRELTLPLHPKLETGHVEYVARTLAKALTR